MIPSLYILIGSLTHVIILDADWSEIALILKDEPYCTIWILGGTLVQIVLKCNTYPILSTL